MTNDTNGMRVGPVFDAVTVRGAIDAAHAWLVDTGRDPRQYTITAHSETLGAAAVITTKATHIAAYTSAGARLLRSVTSTRPHTWCAAYGWHDATADHAYNATNDATSPHAGTEAGR